MIRTNPFQAQSPVVGDDFYGRQEIIAAILDQNQFSHAWVIGARRSGKTSLLKHLAYLVSQNHQYTVQHIPIYWNMEGVKDVRGLTERLIDSLYALKRSHPDKFALLQIDLLQAEQMDLEHIFQQMNRSVADPHIKPLFLCDEVEALVEIATQDQRVISVLRYYFQASWNKTVIAATGGLWNLREPNKDVSPFLSGFIPAYVLGSLTREDALSLIRRKIDDSTNQVIISPAWEEEICHITNRVPFYIQLICRTIYQEKPVSLDEAITISLNSLNFDAILENDLSGLNFVEIFILLQIAEHPGITITELTPLVQQEIEVHNIEDFISNLQRLSYLETTPENKLYIPNNFLRIWYKQHLQDIVEKRNPQSATEFFEHLGNVYTIKGDLEQAIASYQKVVQKEPNFENYFNVGMLYLKCGKHVETVENLEKALQLKPEGTNIRLYLGFAYDLIGQRDKYKENVIKAFKMDTEVAFKAFEYWRRKAQERMEKENEIKAKEKLLSFLTHTLRNILAGAPQAVKQALRILYKILGERYQESQINKTFNNIASLQSIVISINSMLNTYQQFITRPEEFLIQWQQDQGHTADLYYILASALKQVLTRILFQNAHSPQFQKLVALQNRYSLHDIQESFLKNLVNIELTLENSKQVFYWLNEYFPVISFQIEGENVYFNMEGTTRVNFLFACISEILYNALKYMDTRSPIELKWLSKDENFVLVCQNYFSKESTKKTGSQKGLDFIKELVKLVDGMRISVSDPSYSSMFMVQLYIPKTLLI